MRIEKQMEMLENQPKFYYATSERLSKLALDGRLNKQSKNEVVELLSDCASYFRSCCDQAKFYRHWSRNNGFRKFGVKTTKTTQLIALDILGAVLDYARERNYPQFVRSELHKIFSSVWDGGVNDEQGGTTCV